MPPTMLAAKEHAPAHPPLEQEYPLPQQVTGQPQGHIAQHVVQELPDSAHHGPRATARPGVQPWPDDADAATRSTSGLSATRW